MAWRVGCLLVGVLAWAAGSAPHSPSSPASPLRCDVEALRCDVICSFPDLGLHCSRCARRRPMRFGKRGGSARTQDLALPSTSPSFVAAGGDSRPSAAAAIAPLPHRASAMDGLHFVGRPHFFLSKIFWRNRVGQNIPASQERRVKSWRDRKRCLLSAHDPARCPPDNVFRKLFQFANDHDSRREEESNEDLCDIQPRQCSPGNDSSGKHLNNIESSRIHSLNSNEFDKGLRKETGRRKRFNSIKTSRTHSLNSDDYSERFNSIDDPRQPSLNSNDFGTDLRSKSGRSNRFNSIEGTRTHLYNRDDFEKGLNSVESSREHSLNSDDFDTDLRSKTGRSNRFSSSESLRQRPFSSDYFDTDLRGKTGPSRRLNNIDTSNQRSLNSDDFDNDLSSIGSSKIYSLNSNDFDNDLRSKTARSRFTHSFEKHDRDNEKHKRHWEATDEPEKRLRPSEIDNDDVEETLDTHDFDPSRRRRSRRSVVEEVVEGLMEMLDLEVLPVNPKHYGCHDLPFPGLE